jgi:hypothetical protein
LLQRLLAVEFLLEPANCFLHRFTFSQFDLRHVYGSVCSEIGSGAGIIPADLPASQARWLGSGRYSALEPLFRECMLRVFSIRAMVSPDTVPVRRVPNRPCKSSPEG